AVNCSAPSNTVCRYETPSTVPRLPPRNGPQVASTLNWRAFGAGSQPHGSQLLNNPPTPPSVAPESENPSLTSVQNPVLTPSVKDPPVTSRGSACAAVPLRSSAHATAIPTIQRFIYAPLAGAFQLAGSLLTSLNKPAGTSEQSAYRG